jgi:ATP-dependent Zn protease
MIMIAVVALVVVFFRPSSSENPVEPISFVISDAKAGLVHSIVVRGDKLEVSRVNGSTYDSRKEAGISIYTLLDSSDVDTSDILIEVKEASHIADWLGLLLNFLPILFFIGLIYFLMNRTRNA